jgi:hypothetical protein
MSRVKSNGDVPSALRWKMLDSLLIEANTYLNAAF